MAGRFVAPLENSHLISSRHPERERKKKKEKKRKGIDRSKLEEIKNTSQNRQPPFRTCCKHSRLLPYYLSPLLLYYHRIMSTQMREWNRNGVESWSDWLLRSSLILVFSVCKYVSARKLWIFTVDTVLVRLTPG